MNDREKLEMIIMCAQALLDHKQLQLKTITQGWQNTELKIHLVASDIWFSDVEFRVMPEPKTESFRMAWIKSYGGGSPHLLHVNPEDYSRIETWSTFIKWAGEEITYEVPE